MNVEPNMLLAAAVLIVAVASAFDLHRIETRTLVIYTTPALTEVLEKLVIPEYRAATGERVMPVYLTAASEYYRVRLSEDRPEGDLFLHASPLFIEKGFASGHFDTHSIPADVGPNNRSRVVDGEYVWTAFAWSPLVEVYSPTLNATPDLATTPLRMGLPHPQLSNNGIYTVFFFDHTDPEVGQRMVDLTVVQPVNARTNVQGVADGSFDVTLGYEAVVSFYKTKGAKVSYDLPLLNGERITTPVLFCAGIVAKHPHPGAEAFVDFLFRPDIQNRLHTYFMRPVLASAPVPADSLSLADAKILHNDWSQWAELEAALPRYEVR